MRIAVVTLGCRTNQAESTRLEQIIGSNGHQIVELNEGADICIVNTCSVTAKADYQSRQFISRALKAKAEVIVTGCYAELNSKMLEEKHPGIKVISNANKSRIYNLIPSLSSPITSTYITKSRHRPTIKVQDGCNNSCSYCIIPTARGRSRSVDKEEILNEVSRLESLGYEEIVLSGIHLGTYGRDLNIETSLANLLEEILTATSRTRIRLSSIEINEFNDHLLDVIQHERICRHLHIPLQSADDSILSRMNRSYTVKEYGAMLDTISSKFCNISIGTDVIVGFPTEEESNFRNMMSFLNSQQFTYIHVFPYSIRPGTPAANLSPQISDIVKKERVLMTRELSSRKRSEFIESNIGLEHEIIVETLGETSFSGTTSNYIKVLVPTEAAVSSGRLVRIRITGSGPRFASGLPVIHPQLPNK